MGLYTFSITLPGQRLNFIDLAMNLMDLSYVAELATAGSKLNHRFKVKELEGFEPELSNSNLSNSVSNQKGF